MTTFEQIGVNYQLQSTTPQQAQKSFEYSCNCCVGKSRCLYNTCDNCAIRQVHTQTMAIFADNKMEAKKHKDLLLSCRE